MDVPNFGMVLLKLGSGSNHSVQKIPQFSLQEKAIDLSPVFYFHLKDVGIMVVGELHAVLGTFTRPLEPHIPVVS